MTTTIEAELAKTGGRLLALDVQEGNGHTVEVAMIDLEGIIAFISVDTLAGSDPLVEKVFLPANKVEEGLKNRQ